MVDHNADVEAQGLEPGQANLDPVRPLLELEPLERAVEVVHDADVVEASLSGAHTAADVQPAVDAQHPWLGLASFSEETRGYFHGREEEVSELARRVQRKNLTVMFGQSGLFKTSLLRAGLVPRLRGEGYCPVYVRVDYNPDSPSPSEQIKQAIFRATTEAGHWTRPGTAIEGESLWEFLHHRGDLLRDASGLTLLPRLIFDQFEEIFTLAQADDRGNAVIVAFVGNAIFMGIYYSLQRLFKARMFSDLLSNIHFWGWQLIIVAAAITLPMGITTSKEYAELEWPIDIAIALVWIAFGLNMFGTIIKRREKHMYVAIWF